LSAIAGFYEACSSAIASATAEAKENGEGGFRNAMKKSQSKFEGTYQGQPAQSIAIYQWPVTIYQLPITNN
jgi:hypothetical protein